MNVLHSSKWEWEQMLPFDKAKRQQTLAFAALFWVSLSQELSPKIKESYFSGC